MNVHLGRVLLAGVGIGLAACSTLDSINPFSGGEPKAKPAALTTFASRSEIARLWQVSVGSAGENVFVPAVVGSSVYAAGRDGTLARIDQGREVWRIKVGQALSGGVGASANLVVVGTPKGEVLAFHAMTGQPAWQARGGSEISAAPVVRDDMVAVRSGDGRISLFEATDGKRRWVYQRNTPALALRSNAGVVLTATHLYAGFPGGKLVALALNNGIILWEGTVAQPRGTTELERMADIASDPVVDGRMVCAVAYQGRVACFDIDNGRQLWAREVSSSVGVAIGNRTLYVTDDKGTVQAFESASGANVWKQEQLARRGVSRPLVLDRRVAVADYQGYVHLLSEDDGTFLARLATDGSAIVAPPLRAGAGEDGLVVQTKNGAVLGLSVK